MKNISQWKKQLVALNHCDVREALKGPFATANAINSGKSKRKKSTPKFKSLNSNNAAQATEIILSKWTNCNWLEKKRHYFLASIQDAQRKIGESVNFSLSIIWSLSFDIFRQLTQRKGNSGRID